MTKAKAKDDGESKRKMMKGKAGRQVERMMMKGCKKNEGRIRNGDEEHAG